MTKINEIGSEFWDIPIADSQNYLFPVQTQWFVSGRTALQAIIKDLQNCSTVAVPSWSCHSMLKPFVDAGMQLCFYPVYFHNRTLIQEVRLDCDILFLMDYFGYSSDLPDLQNFNGFIIRDLTHSIFSQSYSDADFYFGSLRKWCGFWTGGYAWRQDRRQLFNSDLDNEALLYIKLRKEAMALKNSYITAYSDNIENKEHLKVYNEAEDLLDNLHIASAAERDIDLIKSIDLKFIKQRRRANAELLMDAFKEFLIFPHLNETDIPLFVPILVPNGKRDKLRKILIEQKIYCPVHWPLSNLHNMEERTLSMIDCELS
ncbi:MAG: hypothetical protein GX896_06920, partial [Clostridiales bacterium]|nr:hypothetical protein [Clostridiales bacterium]